MKTSKIIYYCDKCKKQIKENEIKTILDGVYYYELCNKCSLEYEEYKKKVDELEKAIDYLQKEYKFGRYMFVKDMFIGDKNDSDNNND